MQELEAEMSILITERAANRSEKLSFLVTRLPPRILPTLYERARPHAMMVRILNGPNATALAKHVPCHGRMA